MLKETNYAMTNKQDEWYVVVVGGQFAAIPVKGTSQYRLTPINPDAIATGVGLASADIAIKDFETAMIAANTLDGVLYKLADTTVVTRKVIKYPAFIVREPKANLGVDC